MIRYLALAVLLALGGTGDVFAQPRTTPKSGVAAIPDNVAWTVTYKVADKPAAAAPVQKFPPGGELLREENFRSGDLRKETKVYTGGTLTRYVKGSFLLYFDPRSNAIVVQRNDSDAMGGALGGGRFTELAWIKPEFLIKQENYNDVPCDVYQRSWPIPEADGEADSEGAGSVQTSSQGVVTAYIDQKSRLPLALEDPLRSRLYAFTRAPGSEVLPPDFASALQKTEAAILRRTQRYGSDQ